MAKESKKAEEAIEYLILEPDITMPDHVTKETRNAKQNWLFKVNGTRKYFTNLLQLIWFARGVHVNGRVNSGQKVSSHNFDFGCGNHPS